MKVFKDCPLCESKGSLIRIRKPRADVLNGEDIIVPEHKYLCTKCGKEFSGINDLTRRMREKTKT